MPDSNKISKNTHIKNNKNEAPIYDLTNNKKPKLKTHLHDNNSDMQTAEKTSEDYSHKNKFDYDLVNISKGMSLIDNRVKAVVSSKNEHKFVFGSTFLNDKTKEWKITIKNFKNWAGIGICFRDNVIVNKFRFAAAIPNFSHGCFLVSLNGYSWNALNSNENNKLIKDFPSLKPGDEVMVKYNCITNDLTFNFINHGFKYKISDINSTHVIVPCAVLLNNEDELEFEYV